MPTPKKQDIPATELSLSAGKPAVRPDFFVKFNMEEAKDCWQCVLTILCMR